MARRDEERRERAAILHSLVPPNEGSELLLTVTTDRGGREGGREEGEMGVKSFPPPMMFAFAEFARSLLRPDALPPSSSLPPQMVKVRHGASSNNAAISATFAAEAEPARARALP